MLTTKFYLTKRANGFYYICIKYADGKTGWKSTKCRKKPEALHFLHSFEESQNDTKSSQMPTFSEFLKVYEAVQSSVVRKSTMHLYKELANKFLQLNSDRPLNAYTSLEFEQSRAKQIVQGSSVTTVNIYTRAVKTMFNFALKQNILQSNPLENVKQIKQPKSAPAYFTYSDLNKITALVTSEHLKALYVTAFFTGMRVSELVNLKWANIDFPNNQIRISNTDDFTTKSGRERAIPIHPKVLELLLKIDRRNEYIFSKDGIHKYCREYVSHRFKHYSRKVGLPENIKFHSTRHSFASLCVQSGVDIYSVQQLLGHSDISTTQIYTHLTPSHLQTAIDKIQI